MDSIAALIENYMHEQIKNIAVGIIKHKEKIEDGQDVYTIQDGDSEEVQIEKMFGFIKQLAGFEQSDFEIVSKTKKQPAKTHKKKTKTTGKQVERQKWYTIGTYVEKSNACDKKLCSYAPTKGKNENKICGIATDVDADNDFTNEVKCSRCAAKGGKFTRLYSGYVTANQTVESDTENEEEFEAAEETLDYTDEELRDMTVSQLKDVCKRHKLAYSGKNKSELIQIVIDAQC